MSKAVALNPFPPLTIGGLEIRLPIIQGGMGVGISLSRLAAAVANEGGIGVISAAMIGFREPDANTNPVVANGRALEKEIKKARDAMVDGLLGVNVMVALSDFAELVKTSIACKVDVIFAGAGLPMDLPKYLCDGAKTKLVPIVSSGRAAALICKKWLSGFGYQPDAFVVEGPKAGGHLGFKPEQIDDPAFRLEAIIPEVLEAVKPFEAQTGRAIPVIAAGGIYSGEDIGKFLSLGAAGVQMGTRFVATDECDAADGFKQAYVDACESDIKIIKSPVGLPGRAIRTEFLDQVDSGKKRPFACPFKCLVTCEMEKSPYCIAVALINAMKGKLKGGFAFCGSNAHRVTSIVPVRDLIQSLKEGFSEFMTGIKSGKAG